MTTYPKVLYVSAEEDGDGETYYDAEATARAKAAPGQKIRVARYRFDSEVEITADVKEVAR